MDVRGLPDSPGPPDKALLVPADNPYAHRSNPNLRLVWALGLRNPFRFQIDPLNGRLFIADVGWTTYEEMNVADQGGLDFGWPYREGTAQYVTNECGPLPPPGLTPPSYQYARTDYCSGGCAATIVGGVLYRRNPSAPFAFPTEYEGSYFFSDYYEGFQRRLTENAGTWSLATPVAGQPNANDWGREYREVTDYVQGQDGAIYYARMAYNYTDGSGEVRRIAFVNGSLDAPRPKASVVLFAPYPSPAAGEVTVPWSMPRAGNARVTIYDALGRRVRALQPEARHTAGDHRLRWDGRDDHGARVASGVYRVRLVVDGEVQERRLSFLR
jgi:hypothetical protein